MEKRNRYTATPKYVSKMVIPLTVYIYAPMETKPAAYRQLKSTNFPLLYLRSSIW